jgi:signal transduction histidine kinase/uncharacterized protein YhfF
MAGLSAPSRTASHDLAAAGERDLLRTLAAGTAGVVGDAFFRALARHLAQAFDAEVAFVAELVDEARGRARIIASWRHGVELPEGLEFDLAGTPCELTATDDVAVLPTGAVARFPHDAFLAENGLEGYVAVTLRGSDGRRIGHVGVQSTRPLTPTPREIADLSVFAARAAAEIERRRHQAALRRREMEVVSSRSRVVQAADEERRRIGRNLHDGAQQRLVALGHLLTLARRRAGELPDDAARLFEQAADQVRLASDELRELARGLHPAGLSERGLGPALEGLAQASPLDVRLGPLPERRLPDPVELTVFYVVAEGLTNAVKYAQARSVRVGVELTATAVVAHVADDGRGGASPEDGTGLLGLGDRLRALGGTLEVESPLGAGTTLTASIPLAPWRDAREPFLEFGYEDDGGLGEELIGEILAGRKTVTISLQRESELEGGTPRIGQRLPVLDHHGRRHGTVEVTRVAVMPFGEIDEAVVEGESAGARSVEEWRELQRRFYEGCRDEIAMLLGEPGWRLTPDEPMVICWIRLVDDEAATAA